MELTYKTKNGNGKELISFGRYGIATWAVKFISHATMSKIHSVIDGHLEEIVDDPASEWRKALLELYGRAHGEVAASLYYQRSIANNDEVEGYHTYFEVWNYPKGSTSVELDYSEEQKNLILSGYGNGKPKTNKTKPGGELAGEEIDNV